MELISNITHQGCAGYRLPTEAEWEFAARAGSASAFYNGEITNTECTLDSALNAIGWYCGNAGEKTHPIGLKVSNSIGLVDMSGNVAEWVWDGASPYPGTVVTDPGEVTGAWRVARGGSWADPAYACRAADRGPDQLTATGVSSNIGFRLVRSLPNKRHCSPEPCCGNGSCNELGGQAVCSCTGGFMGHWCNQSSVGCDDGFSCTTDVWDGWICTSTIDPGFCLIDNACFSSGQLKPNNPCASCQPSLNSKAWSPLHEGETCDDGKVCTTGDKCTNGVCSGQTVTCSDGVTCTQDACTEPQGCTFIPQESLCQTDQYCHPTQGCRAGKCTNGFIRCQGNVRQQCDANGVFQTLQTCSGSAPYCDASFGCVQCLTDAECDYLYPHGYGTCQNHVCTMIGCKDFWQDCQNGASDGCEKSTECGGCLATCSRDNARTVCTRGTCQIAECNPFFANCDGIDQNGCETPLNTVSNCRSCDEVCTPPEVCTSYGCALPCGADEMRCGDDCLPIRVIPLPYGEPGLIGNTCTDGTRMLFNYHGCSCSDGSVGESPEIIYSWTVDQADSMVVGIQTIDNWDPVLVGINNPYSSSCFSCADETYDESEAQESFIFTGTIGTTVYFAVEGYNNSCGQFQIGIMTADEANCETSSAQNKPTFISLLLVLAFYLLISTGKRKKTMLE